MTSTVATTSCRPPRSILLSSAEIDSPLQNLTIYWQLMLIGYLGTATAPLTLPDGPMNTAARGLGAASDKFGTINVDMVAYINQILGLTDETVPTFPAKEMHHGEEEVKGVVKLVRKCFLDYGAFAYSRAAPPISTRCLPHPIFPPPVLSPAGSSPWRCPTRQSRPST